MEMLFIAFLFKILMKIKQSFSVCWSGAVCASRVIMGRHHLLGEQGIHRLPSSSFR